MVRILKEAFIILAAVIAVIYLINPGFGALELIPDFAPVIGNLDEATAVLILLNTLRYYGLDLTGALNRRREEVVVEAIPQKNTSSH